MRIQGVGWSNGDGEGAGDLIFFEKVYNNF